MVSTALAVTVNLSPGGASSPIPDTGMSCARGALSAKSPVGRKLSARNPRTAGSARDAAGPSAKRKAKDPGELLRVSPPFFTSLV